MNIGQIGNVTVLNVGSDAAGTCYATIDENNVKKGDAVSLSDSGGPKSLTINGDFNMSGIMPTTPCIPKKIPTYR